MAKNFTDIKKEVNGISSNSGANYLAQCFVQEGGCNLKNIVVALQKKCDKISL